MDYNNNVESKITLPYLTADHKIILGLSGGPDSVFLFHYLLSLNPRPTIIICHANYHLRGWASNTDQSFVETLAQKYKLKVEVTSIQPGQLKGNLEENCRHIRYQFFEEIRQKYNADWIMTAHNQDDQIETFLMNLIRGASFSGFSSIKEIDPDRHLCRPLLNLSKAEILNHLKTNKIVFRQDQSNFDLKFRRNFLRHEIIPKLKELNPNLNVTLSETIRNFQENQQLIEIQIQNWLDQNLQILDSTPDNTVQFDLNSFLSTPPALQKKILIWLHKTLHHQSFTSHQLKEILQTLQKNKAGLRKEFGSKAQLEISKSPQNQKRLVVIKPKLH